MTERRWCAGGDALQQRELARWWLAGRSARAFAALAGADAIRQILAGVVGIFVGHDESGAIVTEGLTLDPSGECLRPHVHGRPLDLEEVAPLMHPGVADPGIACEATSPLTPEELAEFRRLDLGAGWKDGPGRGTTIGLGA
jgi:hypothetical protein